jgi:hypothetical protein
MLLAVFELPRISVRGCNNFIRFWALAQKGDIYCSFIEETVKLPTQNKIKYE